MSLTILIIEDGVEMQNIWKRRLEAKGVTVLSAFNQISAREQIEKYGNNISLISFDGHVPGAVPPTTTLLAQETRANGYTGIMLATSYDAACREQLINAGCTYTVSKDHLVEHVLELLKIE